MANLGTSSSEKHEAGGTDTRLGDGPYSSHGLTSSRVDVDFLDPEGVRELQRSLSQSSPHEDVERVSKGDDESELTLTVNENDFDMGKLLRQLVKKRDEANVKSRTLGIMFQGLRVVGLGTAASYQPTLGSVLNPLNIFGAIGRMRHPQVRDILSGFEGVIRPGEMILVLGRPGSGCSTLLKTLANQRQEFHSVEGEVLYDALTSQEVYKHYRGDVTYVGEDDVHFPSLTVEQTLDFAAKTRAPHSRVISKKTTYVNLFTTALTTIFGLRHTRKTPVGDAAIRGVSGGEKKRVSIAEALAARAHLCSWDNSTRGLDASTALEYLQALRIATDTASLTSIVSIYQAGENCYDLFDKVCVINEGHMVYFGDARSARQYFLDLGFEPETPRMTTADFLVSITDYRARRVRADVSPSSVPRSALEFAQHFKNSPGGRKNSEDIENYRAEFAGNAEKAAAYRDSAWAERGNNANKTSPYTISIPAQIQAVMVRRIQILLGNKLALGLAIGSFVFQAIIIGTVFLQLSDTTGTFFSRGGVIFFSLLFASLTAMAEIPALYQQRAIVVRQSKSALYHSSIEAAALTLVDIPLTLLITVLFSLILYFLCDLQRSAGQFFVFVLITFTTTICMKAFFRMLAAAFQAEAAALGFAGLAILLLGNYSGYTVPYPTMVKALRWISWISPFRYAFEALLANEFSTIDSNCATLVPQGPTYENVSLANQVCTTIGAIPGIPTVDGNRFIELSFTYSADNIWRNFGILVGFTALFITGLLAFTEFSGSSSGPSAVTLFKRSTKVHAKLRDETSDGKLQHGDEDGAASSKKEDALVQPTTSQGHTFSWQGINYTVPTSAGDRRLLHDVSGYVAPGLTALMGESGAGKTTLLNVLARRVNMGVVTGNTFVNGREPPVDFSSQTAYCQQMDTHLGSSTVREALQFSARLRQPASVPNAEKDEYVEKCLEMCGLEAHGDAIVGSLGIEHRKRVTIGVELAARPRLLLFLDEPTSGLDSQSASAIMHFLRSLADKGQAILCTIHQPSAELFQVFDKLLLLRKGGETVYNGQIGSNSATLIDYFQRQGARSCEPHENPAEWMLDVIGAGATAQVSQDWYDLWIHSPESRSIQTEIEAVHAEGRNRPAVEATQKSEFATSWIHQTTMLVQREARRYWRNPTYLLAKLILNIVGGLFIGFTFWKSTDGQQGTQNKLFAIYMALILAVPLSNQLQGVFLHMREIYVIRERPSRMYSWSALVTSQILIEIPWNILGSSMFFVCWYWTIGFAAERAGYTYLLIGVLFPLYYTTIGQAVAAMAPNPEIAALLFSFLFSFVVTFNGVLQPYSELGGWQWMYWISPYTYLIDGILGQAIGNQEINCSAVEFSILTPPKGKSCGEYMAAFISFAGGYLGNPEATEDCAFCAFRTSNQFLEKTFNIFYDNRYRDIGVVVGFIVFNTAAVFAMTWFFRVRTGSILSMSKKKT